VRHYVQVGVLTASEREGREAMFGLRQVVEFLAARYLLKDGWPLAKVAEMVRTTDLDGLAVMIPTDRPRTRVSAATPRAAPTAAASSASSSRRGATCTSTSRSSAR
jgi:hypothetical protein